MYHKIIFEKKATFLKNIKNVKTAEFKLNQMFLITNITFIADIFLLVLTW